MDRSVSPSPEPRWCRESLQEEGDQDENAHQREAIRKFYGSVDRRSSLDDASEGETADHLSDNSHELSDDEEAHNGSDRDGDGDEEDRQRDQDTDSPQSKSDMEGEDVVVCARDDTESPEETCELPPICEAPECVPCRDETEYVPCGSKPMVEREPVRRASYTEAEKPKRGRRMTKTQDHRRYSSLTELCRLKSRLKTPNSPFVAPKASLARPAVTAVTVHSSDSPRLATVLEHPEDRYRTAQTIQSDLGICQMLWEELLPSRTSSTSTMFTDENVLAGPSGATDTAPMMEQVKTKLTAWKWSREFMEDSSDDKGG